MVESCWNACTFGRAFKIAADSKITLSFLFMSSVLKVKETGLKSFLDEFPTLIDICEIFLSREAAAGFALNVAPQKVCALRLGKVEISSLTLLSLSTVFPSFSCSSEQVALNSKLSMLSTVPLSPSSLSFSSDCDAFPVALTAFSCKAFMVAISRLKQELRVSPTRRFGRVSPDGSIGAETFLSASLCWSSSLSEAADNMLGSMERLLLEPNKGDKDMRRTAKSAFTDF